MITVNKGIPFGLRQLAAVLLKQFIKQHWQEDEGTVLHPVVSAEEKGAIRQLLLPSLDDPHGKIRTAVGMVIASIAHYDWPEDWPELLPFLLQLISGQNNIDGVRGSLRCLALLSGDLDDTLVPKLVPALFPHLQTILSSPNSYEKSLRAKAVEIMHSCISVLGSMTGVYKTEVMAMMTPMLNSLLEQFSVILQPPVQPEDPDDWGIRMEVLKCLLQLVQNFPSLLKAQFSIIVAPLWQMVVSSLKVYQLAAIQGSEDPHSGTYDSDGAEKSLESFVIQAAGHLSPTSSTNTTLPSQSFPSFSICWPCWELACHIRPMLMYLAFLMLDCVSYVFQFSLPDGNSTQRCSFYQTFSYHRPFWWWVHSFLMWLSLFFFSHKLA